MALDETDSGRSADDVKRIEALASALGVGIMLYDRNDTLIACSSHFLQYFDIDPELLKPGARLRDLFNATYDTDARSFGSFEGPTRQISREDWVAERIAIHWRERYESVEQLADGRWIRLRKRRMSDGFLISTSEDVTDQKNNEKEVAEKLKQAELVNVILDDLSIQVIVKDSELRYVMVNDAFCRIFGLPRKYILGRKAADFVGHELAARFEALETQVLETGIPYDALEDIHSADGSVMKVITRMRRTGTPGAYCVTISFDNIGEMVAAKTVVSTGHAGSFMASMPENKVAVRSEPVLKGRVLVIDEDPGRSVERVAALKGEQFDAVATNNAIEAVAFLDAAEAMELEVNAIEISDHMARALSREGKASRHGRLGRAIANRLAGENMDRSAGAAPVVEPLAEKPVLSVVTSAPAPAGEKSVAGMKQVEPEARTPLQPASVTQTAQARDKVRVLVAEDNDVNQIVFEQILEGIGVDFRIVNNGEEAVAAWRASVPDLILMDVSMPVMNGLQAVQAIRDAEANEPDSAGHVPVIAVTAHAMGGDRERCLAAGMDDYLSKPVNPEKLEALIHKWVENAERFRAAG